jgi:hypothetical protein
MLRDSRFTRSLALPAVLLTCVLAFEAPAFGSDAMIAYYSTTASGGNFPKIRVWSSAGSGSWGTEVELSSAGSPVREAVIKSSPVSTKKVLVTESDDGFLDGYVCLANCGSAGSWTLSADIGQIWGAFPPGESFVGFDVEFETATGAAMLVYNLQGGSSVQDLAYKTLAPGATSFPGSPSGYVDLGGDLSMTWVELDRKPVATSEELILAAYATTNNQTYAKVWNGSAWVSETTLLVDTPNGIGREKLAVRYAADGSKGMVLAADNDSAGTPVMRSKYWNGTSWTTATPMGVAPFRRCALGEVSIT